LVEEVVVGWATIGTPRDTDLDPASTQELYGLTFCRGFGVVGSDGLFATRPRTACANAVDKEPCCGFSRKTGVLGTFMNARAIYWKQGEEKHWSTKARESFAVRYQKSLQLAQEPSGADKGGTTEGVGNLGQIRCFRMILQRCVGRCRTGESVKFG
jgi:hypothetical protein